jgi:hypothetical protein
MARRSDARQLALDGFFEVPKPIDPAPGSQNFDHELRGALHKAIKDSPLPREEIAAEMDRLLGSDPDYPVTKATLDSWTAPSRTDWRFPLLYLPAFVQVTGAHWVLELVARRCGCTVLVGKEALLAQLGQAKSEKTRWSRTESAILRQLGDER